MLGNFRVALILAMMLSVSGVAFEEALPRVQLLSRQEIVEACRAGVESGATHMLIVVDTWDIDDLENFVVYCYPGQDVEELIGAYAAPGFYRVSAVIDLDLDVNQELSE